MITKIKIENIKGYGVPGVELNVNIDSKKINICIAPNGFGKSSLATAFQSLKRNRLDVFEENKNSSYPGKDSSLELTIDGEVYRADARKNCISSDGRIYTYVINSKICPGYKKTSFNGFTNVNAFLAISDIELCNAKEKRVMEYKVAGIKKEFGRNGKILKSIAEYLNNDNFMSELDVCFPAFEEFCKVRSKKHIDSIRKIINELDGTSEQICAKIECSVFNEIEANQGYKQFNEYVQNRLIGMSQVDTFLLFYQMQKIYAHDKRGFKSIREYAAYSLYKRRMNENIELLNSSNSKIVLKEENGKLKIKFPPADKISNGQRDVLTFAVELMKFRSSRRSDCTYILVIDEIFDYLDDANTIAAQYYLSEMIKDNKDNVYLMLLTHLNPYNFRCYMIKDKLINPVYLENTKPHSLDSMKHFIALREDLEKDSKDEDKKNLYDELSSHHFHYNPTDVDLSLQLKCYKNIKYSWGDSMKFKAYLTGEVNKYFEKSNTYDPYSVAVALRIIIEKRVYKDLASTELQQQFLKAHTTAAKFDLAENAGVLVPDVYMLANVIHNEASHLSFNKQTKVDIDHSILKEKSIVYSLQNAVIRNMIMRIFEYAGKPFTSSSLF